MKNPTVPTTTKTRMAGAFAVFVGVQALYLLGSYFFPRFPLDGISRGEKWNITVWTVIVANVLVLGGGYLLRLRKKQVEDAD